jgi:hypothetical protein
MRSSLRACPWSAAASVVQPPCAVLQTRVRQLACSRRVLQCVVGAVCCAEAAPACSSLSVKEHVLLQMFCCTHACKQHVACQSTTGSASTLPIVNMALARFAARPVLSSRMPAALDNQHYTTTRRSELLWYRDQHSHVYVRPHAETHKASQKQHKHLNHHAPQAHDTGPNCSSPQGGPGLEKQHHTFTPQHAGANLCGTKSNT